MISNYLKLRLKLLYRSLGNHRLLLSIFLFVIVTFLCFGLVKIEFENQYAIPLINFGFLILIFFYHTNRPDMKMLGALTGRKSLLRLISIEYLILTTPIIGLMCLRGFYYSIALLIVPFILPYMKQNTGRIGMKLSPFGKGNFEWNSGFRKYSLLHFAVALFFVFSCIVKLNFNISMFLMGATLLVFTFNYSIHESSQFIIQYRSPQEMLNAKLGFILRYATIIGVVLSLVIGFSYQELSWFYLIIVLQINIILITMMLTKFAYYPNKLASEANQTILLIFGMIPFLAPVLIFLNIHFYKKATARLKSFHSL